MSTYRFLFMLLILLAAVGCSNSPGDGNTAAQTEEVKPGEPAPVQQEAPMVRTVTHAYGEVTIPAEPKRIVVLDNGALDNLLAMGVKPVGAPAIISVEAGFSKYLKGTEGITNIGTVDQPNLEAVAALKPDLILGNKDRQDAVYDKLKQIAPTYFVEKSADAWKQNVLHHADAVNKPAEGKKLMDDYEKRIAHFKTAMGKKLETTEVTLIRPRQDRVALYLVKSFSGMIADEAGLRRPAAQRGDALTQNATEEQIADLDGDVLIWFGREQELTFFQDKIQKNPIWGTLKAVKNNQVHQVDWETWLSGSGIQSVNLILDDMYRIFGVPKS